MKERNMRQMEKTKKSKHKKEVDFNQSDRRRVKSSKNRSSVSISIIDFFLHCCVSHYHLCHSATL